MKNNKIKLLLNSAWVLLGIPGIFLGGLAGLGMFLAGKKVNVNRWRITGLVYIVLQAGLLIAYIAAGAKSEGLLLDLYLYLWIISIIHSIVIEVKFVPLMKRTLEGNIDYIAAPTVKSTNATVVKQKKSKVNNKSEDPVILSTDMYSVGNTSETVQPQGGVKFDNDFYDALNNVAATVKVDPADSPIPSKAPSIIDINNCSEKELAALPGVSVVGAKKAIAYRDAHGKFSSVDEFYKAADLQVHFIKQIKDKITCDGEEISTNYVDTTPVVEPTEPVEKEDDVPAAEKKGRVLDF